MVFTSVRSWQPVHSGKPAMIHGSNLRKIYHNVQSNTRLNLRFPTAKIFSAAAAVDTLPRQQLQTAIERLSTGQLKNSFANQRAQVSHVGASGFSV